MSVRRDPTAEARVLLAMQEYGEDTRPRLAARCGYTYMQMRRILNLLMGEGKVTSRQRNGVVVYGVAERVSDTEQGAGF